MIDIGGGIFCEIKIISLGDTLLYNLLAEFWLLTLKSMEEI